MSRFTRFIGRIDATGIPLLIARLGVGGLYAWLAYSKLADEPSAFLKQIHEYHIFPASQFMLLNLTAMVLPWLEMLCAVALLLGFCLRGAGLVLFGMFCFFAPALLLRAWGIYHGPDFVGTFCDVKFDCGCGTGEVYICSKMLENTVAQILCLIPIFSNSRFLCISSLFRRRKPTTAVTLHKAP